jgi:5-formyltetrahydrofolate cyclo-ligase
MGPVVKHRMRAKLLAARAHVTAEVHSAEAMALCSHARTVARGEETVAAYVPIGSEPGSVELLDELLRICSRVLLPVARTAVDGVPLPLQWGVYRPGSLISAPFGLLEPPAPWLPPAALQTAGILLVPALAVDRYGVRLGRGAGFYDRSLHFRAPSANVVAVVRDDELVERLPVEPHDVRMTHALTPASGLVTLSASPDRRPSPKT